MSDEKITSLADFTNDGSFSNPEQALQQALADLGKYGAFENGKKILILGLDDAEENYGVSFIQAGMTMSQCIALCEVAKTLFLREMNY